MHYQEDKKEYEIAFLTKEEAAVPEIVSLIKHADGEIAFEGQLKKISLAYRIKKESQAYFGYVNVRLAPSRVEELAKSLEINPHVLRTLIVMRPAQSPEPPRGERPKREAAVPREMVAAAPKAAAMPLSNEDLEKKIDEILG